MRKVYLFFILLCTISYPQLNQVGYFPGISLSEIQFVDSVGFACGREGLICKSTDYGETWFQLDSVISNHLTSLYMLNKDTIFFVGENVILKTTNSGKDWSIKNYDCSFNKIDFANKNSGFAVGSGNKIYTTSNCGMDWDTRNTDAANLYTIFFVDSLIGYTGSDNDYFYKTTDSGNSWEYFNHFPQKSTGYHFTSIFFINDSIGFVGTAQDGVFHTTDSGFSWDNILKNAFDSLAYKEVQISQITFSDKNNGWILSYGNIYAPTMISTIYYVFHTSDGGNNWTAQEVPSLINSMYFSNSTLGWLVGYEKIYKTSNGELTSVKFNNNVVGYKLEQNYPNPFNSSTIISYSLPTNTNILIEIYNILGEKVTTLYSGYGSAGEHQIKFDADNLSSGIYLVRFNSPQFSKTIKVVLLK